MQKREKAVEPKEAMLLKVAVHVEKGKKRLERKVGRRGCVLQCEH